MSGVADIELARRYPTIEWRKPILVRVGSERPLLCCRVCIALAGLRAGEVQSSGFGSVDEFTRHLAECHPEL